MKKLLLVLTIIASQSIGYSQPLNDIAHRKVVPEKQMLQWNIPNERDILWQKTTWRVIDVREKINHPFMYPLSPFFDLLVEAAKSGDIQLYHPLKDDFSVEMDMEDMNNSLFKTDTIPVWENQDEMTLKVVQTSVFYEDIKRFRLKEIWYFDTHDSQLKVRILGIAPLQEVYGEDGYFRYEKPLFWVHYPTSREVFARERVFVESNEAARTTWEDFFEMRKFSSYITKEGNVRDNRLEELYSGVDLLLESDKIKQDIFNYEHDLWSY